ncbi:MAG TPA: energy transducer TonB [Terriglobales bacterium]|nr:energy transducer TonB [Terriglobales bacterium]
MFADSLCDTHWDNRSHRVWTTLFSFGLQVMAVASLLALPFLYTQGLPSFLSPPQLLAPMARPTTTPQGDTAPVRPRRWANIVIAHPFVYRRNDISHSLHPENPNVAPPDINVGGSGGPGYPTIEGFNPIGSAPPLVMPHSPVPAHHPPMSHMMEGNLVHRVEPVYPALARQTRIQGAVLLRAMISKNGEIENLQLLSGHPMLAPAAIEAVRQWRYRPYFLNGDPVEVETQVTVKFTLSGG